MNTFRKGLDSLLGAVCCLMLAIMVGIACWQVMSRYILGVPSTITEEMLRFLLVWVSMLGMAFVAGQKQHISLTFCWIKRRRPFAAGGTLSCRSFLSHFPCGC